MAGYIGNKSSVVSSGAERKFKFTITETTTTLSNLAYTPNLVHVFHNGIRLVDGTDYTATNGTSITLTNAAENGDEVVVVSYASFQLSDTVSASLGGAFEGNVTVNGDLTVDTDTLFVDAATNEVGIGTTTAARSARLTVKAGNSTLGSGYSQLSVITSDAQAADVGGSIVLGGQSTAADWVYGSVSGRSENNSYAGYLAFGTSTSLGAHAERMRIDSAGNVTKPYQPMFLGYPTNDYSGGSMPTGVMSVTALLNNGGHFNASNSRFTAPVAGWYLTTWGGLQLTNTVTSLMINGARQHNGNHGVFTGGYVTMTQTVIRYLNAGDYFNIEQWNGGGYFSSWYVWSVTLLG